MQPQIARAKKIPDRASREKSGVLLGVGALGIRVISYWFRCKEHVASEPIALIPQESRICSSARRQVRAAAPFVSSRCTALFCELFKAAIPALIASGFPASVPA